MDAPIDYSLVKKNTLSPAVRSRSTATVKSDDTAHCNSFIEQQHSPVMKAKSTKRRKTNHAEPLFDPDSTITSNEPTLYVCRLCDQMFDSMGKRKVHEREAHLIIIEGEGSHHANGLRIHQYSKPMKDSRGHVTSDHDLHVCDKTHPIKVALNAQPKVVLRPMKLKQPARCADPEESNAEQSRLSSQVKKNVTMKRKQLMCESCPETFTNVKAVNCHSQKHHCCSPEGTAVALKTKPVRETRSSSEVEGISKQQNTRASDKVLKNMVGILITPYIAPNNDSHQYKCMVCTNVFGSFEGVQSHYLTHHSSKNFSKVVPFQCSVCLAVFRNYSGIKGHISVHSPKCFNCPYCDQTFTKKMKFTRHVKLHQRAFLTCDNCSRTFRTSLGHVSHKCRERSGRSVKNDRTRNTAANESATNRSSEVFRCKYCPREFSTSNGCNRHISKIHSCCRLVSENEQQPGTKGPVLCELCGLQLVPDQVDSHMRGHTFNNRRLAKIGKVNAELKELAQFGCDMCDKVFICRTDLSEHVRVHADDQMLVEDSSSNRKSAVTPIATAFTPLKISMPFTRLPALSAHEHTHPTTSGANLENIISNQLSTNVAQSRLMKMDQRTRFELMSHIEEKQQNENKRYTFEPCDTAGRYRCSECDEIFSEKLQMLIHMSYHLNGGQQPNELDISLLIKVESSLLAPHMCKFCDQRFITTGHLKLHMGKHHRSELLECKICEELCVGKKELEEHNEREHAQFHCVYCGLRCRSDASLVHHMEMECKMRQAQEISKDLKMEVKSEIKLEITSSEETFFGNKDYNDDGTANSSMAEMKVEMENMTGSELFHCNCCNRNFASELDMYAHENQPQNLLFCCGLCDLFFFDASLAEVHSKMHILSQDNRISTILT